MTERPRTIERLRSERAVYEDRLEAAEKAIANIDEKLAPADSADVKEVLARIRQGRGTCRGRCRNHHSSR